MRTRQHPRGSGPLIAFINHTVRAIEIEDIEARVGTRTAGSAAGERAMRLYKRAAEPAGTANGPGVAFKPANYRSWPIKFGRAVADACRGNAVCPMSNWRWPASKCATNLSEAKNTFACGASAPK